jgi:hypothetical protein
VELPGSGLHLRPQLLAVGYDDAELRVLRRRGVAVTVRPGAYVPADDPRLDSAHSRHLLAVRATAAGLGAGAVISHVSAAVLHGWPVWSIPLRRVHVTRDRPSGGRRGRQVHLHTARLRDDEVVRVEGIAVTSPARTVLDVCRSAAHEPAVVIADAALRSGAVDAAELSMAVERAARRPGLGAARRAIEFADGRSESVGESRSRVAVARARLPDPIPQFEVHVAGEGHPRSCDLGWPELRTVGEFDGMVKYGRFRRPGETVADAVVREKLREDAIRDTGLRVVRWTWTELGQFAVVVDRLQRAFAAA